MATIKHNRHGFEIDHEGKDSWRHKQAGAVATVVASPGRIALIEDTPKDYDLAEIRDRYIRNADIVLAEGYKIIPTPRSRSSGRNSGASVSAVPGTISSPWPGIKPVSAEVPWFDWNDAGGLADLIEKRFLDGKA